MSNPNGPYPGRQLFLGMTKVKEPCFAYLVSGRSPESRERKAVLMNDVVRMGPIGNTAYDALRHYVAIKFDNATGLAAVSNGIQTEAIYETYRLLMNTAVSAPDKTFMEKILDGAGAEPDSYHTPRIAGMITRTADKSKPIFIIGMKAYELPAKAVMIEPKPGTMTGISTYTGSMESPAARNPASTLPEIEFTGNTPENLANFLFGISAATYNDKDIRVCTVAGILTDKGWNLAINNVHN